MENNNNNNNEGQGAGAPAPSRANLAENGLLFITQDILRRLFHTQEENKELFRRTHDLCKGNTELLSQSLRSKMELENAKKELEKVREEVEEREEVNVQLAHGIVKAWRTMHGQLQPPHQSESGTLSIPVTDIQNMIEDIYQHFRRGIVLETARYSQPGGSAHFHGNYGGLYYSTSGSGGVYDPYNARGNYCPFGYYGNGGVAPSVQAPAASAAIGAQPNLLQQREQANIGVNRGERMVRAQEAAAAIQFANNAGANNAGIIRGANNPGIIRGANNPGIIRGANNAGIIQGANNAAIIRGANNAAIVRGAHAAAAVQAQPDRRVPQPQRDHNGIAHGEDFRRWERELRRRAFGPYARGRWMRLGRGNGQVPNAGAGDPNSMRMQPALMMVPLALGNQFGGSLMDGFGYIGSFDHNNNAGGDADFVEREWEADEEDVDEGEEDGDEDGNGEVEGEGEGARAEDGAARAGEER